MEGLRNEELHRFEHCFLHGPKDLYWVGLNCPVPFPSPKILQLQELIKVGDGKEI